PELSKRTKALLTSTIAAPNLVAADAPGNSLRLSPMNIHRPSRHDDDNINRGRFPTKSLSPVIILAHL
ncbi:hypothetical protein TorRG33x02_277180, partial [Trema orientale]